MNEKLAVDAIRVLAVDEVQAANSGHPGFPLGAAPILYELFAHHLKHTPSDPKWFNRDRFVLSAGHGSAMLYAILHLFGYEGLTLDELKKFRQLGSKTPGHPEYGHTAGVEATTGPLGAGMGMAVGMAIAEAHLAAVFNKEDNKIIDHYTFALGGEGCLMEGISSEVFSLAGTLGLGKLIVLFDSNDITIEGGVDIAFTEDVSKRMEAFGFQVLEVSDGNDTAAVGKAIESAKAELSKPSFIKIKTKIGYGVPDREGTAKAHGEPIGADNVPILRKQLGWPLAEPFAVPDEVYAAYATFAEAGLPSYQEWEKAVWEYAQKYPAEKAVFDRYLAGEIPEALFRGDYFKFESKADATRNVSGRILNEMKDQIPFLIGGSADLGPSNKTELKGAGDFSREHYAGRNLHFGVREIGMTSIGNGILLHGGLRPYVSTFFVFSDYMKPMLRLSALMNIPLIAVLTHDSIGVGEDGPTHEPIEQLTMLRATPNINVYRPADEFETRVAWKQALLSRTTPSVLVLSRQNLPVLSGASEEAEKGAYILEKEGSGKLDLILLASGSEVAVTVEAKKALEEYGINARVVSVPCMDVFEKQTDEYKDYVLPPEIRRRIAVEAGSSLSWGKLVGPGGDYVAMDRFGASAPAAVLFEAFGFDKNVIVNKARKLVG
ncbi:MAG: transketolase [Clostridiales Family XIII bacterium]|jgi:transketolase|nr:transketolase [Clostridiales Family XIII bacterium]